MKQEIEFKLKTIICICFLLFVNSAKAGELLWSEDFDGSQLNNTFWHHHNSGERFEGFNTENAVRIKDGNLFINTQKAGNRIETGAISTKGLKSFNAGYLEIRLRAPNVTSGVKCSVQLQSPKFGNKKIDPDLSPAKTGSVLSVVDYSSVLKGSANSVVNWGDWGENRNRIIKEMPRKLNDGEYHVLGVEIFNDRYQFYVDGVQYWTVDQGISGIEMYLIIGCEVKAALGTFPENIGTETLFVDYIRHYNEIPSPDNQLTGQPIKNNDWEFKERDSVSFGAHWDDPSFSPSQPYDHDAIKITLQEGSHRGAGGQFNIPGDVSEAWISYCMKFSTDWDAEVGGKLPGFAATSSRWSGGYGGKPSTGDNGWSARMLYGAIDPENGTIPVGHYIYHNDPESDNIYGDPDWWVLSSDRLVKDSIKFQRGKWYEITQRLKLNEKDEFDGVIEGWVDGELAYQRQGLNFTNASKYRKISRFWLNVYHGGEEVATDAHSIYFDQFNYTTGSAGASSNCINN